MAHHNQRNLMANPSATHPGTHPVPPKQNFKVYGYARSKMSDEAFRDFIASNLTCRIDGS